MAPILDNENMPQNSGVNNGLDSENIWAAILEEVRSTERTKLPACKNVLVLGDNESGKTTLIAKLQGNEDPKKGSGLEYSYIDVRDEYREDHTRLGVWVLDGDPHHSHLLNFALNESSFCDTLVILTVSMSQPWTIMDSLQTWASILQDHVDSLSLSCDKIKDCQQMSIKRWQDYTEPEEYDLGSSPVKRSSRHLEEENVLLPLGEETLTRNLGLDIMVVVNKTDYMAVLEKDFDYKDEHFDFIQQSIRKFSLHYGAALFYTSVKEDKNCDLLYKYLVHRIYNLPFKFPALVVEKDAVFIPSGWDSVKKISILYENMHTMTPEDYYTDVIVRPVVRKMVAREVEVQAEDEQTFLSRQQQLLQVPTGTSPNPSPIRQESPLRAGTAVQKTSERRMSGSPGSTQLASPKKMDGAKPGLPGTATSEGALANFFNSLLSKKSGGSPGNKTIEKAAMRSDAAAELDRLTRNKNMLSTSENHNSTSDC